MNEALTQFTDWFAGAPLRIATVIAIAIVVHFSANRAISRSMNKLIAKTDRGAENRAAERAHYWSAPTKFSERTYFYRCWRDDS